jgi:hypothetical protein
MLPVLRQRLRRFATRFLFNLLVLVVAAIALDSQIVLQRYELEMADLKAPAAMIFSYAVSQAGTTAIEQRHRIYRSGLNVRDETIAVDGETLRPKIVRISRREDRYDIMRLAPRGSGYAMLLLREIPNGTHVDYEYETTPLRRSGAFTVTRVVIDGLTFLPRRITFRTASASASGEGEMRFVKSGAYCVPIGATVEASENGKPARERITWSDYRFPPSLPPSTFIGPKPLPTATLPPI